MEHIARDIEEVVRSIQDPNGMPYFFKGHRLEVNNILSTMDKDKVNKEKRYPCIVLWMDFTPPKVIDTFLQYSLNLSIAAPTPQQVLVEHRLENVIYPILAPIYDKFMEALGNAGLFFWPGSLTLPPHSPTERPYWGIPTPERNRAFFLNDMVDVIEITNLLLNKEPTCVNY